MNDGIKTYAGMFDYEYMKEPNQYYVGCLDTNTRFIVWYDKQQRAWFTTYDDTRVDGLYDAIEKYEKAYTAMLERVARFTDDRGAVIS